MRGHAEHDDAFYVPKELAASWEQRDPIQNLLSYIERSHLTAEFDRTSIDERIAREVDEALRWAEECPLPDASTQDQGVYATPLGR
jgi:TPP-dependent pyruvate/acetoin dehydrogenase alpha subunit